MHVYPLNLRWTGDTSQSPFSRAATASVDGKPDIAVSSGMGDGADVSKWNPEDLLGASLGQCHLLTFLALAAKVQLKMCAEFNCGGACDTQTLDVDSCMAASSFSPGVFPRGFGSVVVRTKEGQVTVTVFTDSKCSPPSPFSILSASAFVTGSSGVCYSFPGLGSAMATTLLDTGAIIVRDRPGC